jgi:ribosomal-protein-alanine N-acetyltransferase
VEAEGEDRERMSTVEDRAKCLDGGAGDTFFIRRAEVADVDAVAAIEASSFSNPWQPQTFRSLIQEGRAHILVAESPASTILGYAVAWWIHEQGELANLAVLPDFRGRGVGSALLDRVLADLRSAGVESLFLEVRVSNRRAAELYLSRGFSQVAVRPDYYRNPREDARILLKRLGGDGAPKGAEG